MKRTARLLIVAAALFEPGIARAVTCSWDTLPPNMNFGTYSVFNPAPTTTTTTFQVKCTPPGSATITLNTGFGGSYSPRLMFQIAWPPVTLGYNLYLDAANTIIWGDGTGGTQYLTLTPAGGTKTYTITIYGTIPAGYDAQPGTYYDQIQATLNYGGTISQQNFIVQATVISECTVATTPINFGAYDPVIANKVAPLDSTGTVSVNCTKGTTATVTLDYGSHASGTTRRMLGSSGDLLTYELYTDAARSVIWNTTNTDGGTSTSKNSVIAGGFTAYGRVFGGQDISVGSYSDTVLVTVNY